MKTVFLDRDGVINNDTGYVGKWDDFFFLPGVIGALDILTQEGYRVIVVTNQSGIARGYYSEVDYLRLEREIDKYLRSINIFITATYYCPHHVDGSVKKYSINCDCRKPSPGMLIRASKDYNFDFSQATMIGDKDSDMQVAQSVGIPNRYFIDLSMSADEEIYKSSTIRFRSLLDSVKFLTKAC